MAASWRAGGLRTTVAANSGDARDELVQTLREQAHRAENRAEALDSEAKCHRRTIYCREKLLSRIGVLNFQSGEPVLKSGVFNAAAVNN